MNNSSVPVYDVVLTFIGSEGQGKVITHEVGVLPPGRVSVDYPRQWITEFNDPDDYEHAVMSVPQVDVAITFTDAAGYVWQRNHRGELGLLHADDSYGSGGDHPIWTSASRGRA